MDVQKRNGEEINQIYHDTIQETNHDIFKNYDKKVAINTKIVVNNPATVIKTSHTVVHNYSSCSQTPSELSTLKTAIIQIPDKIRKNIKEEKEVQCNLQETNGERKNYSLTLLYNQLLDKKNSNMYDIIPPTEQLIKAKERTDVKKYHGNLKEIIDKILLFDKSVKTSKRKPNLVYKVENFEKLNSPVIYQFRQLYKEEEETTKSVKSSDLLLESNQIIDKTTDTTEDQENDELMVANEKNFKTNLVLKNTSNHYQHDKVVVANHSQIAYDERNHNLDLIGYQPFGEEMKTEKENMNKPDEYSLLNAVTHCGQFYNGCNYCQNLIQNDLSKKNINPSGLEYRYKIATKIKFDEAYSSNNMASYEQSNNYPYMYQNYQTRDVKDQSAFKYKPKMSYYGEKINQPESLLNVVPLLEMILNQMYEISSKISDIDEQLFNKNEIYSQPSFDQHLSENGICKQTPYEKMYFDTVPPNIQLQRICEENQDQNISAKIPTLQTNYNQIVCHETNCNLNMLQNQSLGEVGVAEKKVNKPDDFHYPLNGLINCENNYNQTNYYPTFMQSPKEEEYQSTIKYHYGLAVSRKYPFSNVNGNYKSSFYEGSDCYPNYSFKNQSIREQKKFAVKENIEYYEDNAEPESILTIMPLIETILDKVYEISTRIVGIDEKLPVQDSVYSKISNELSMYEQMTRERNLDADQIETFNPVNDYEKNQAAVINYDQNVYEQTNYNPNLIQIESLQEVVVDYENEVRETDLSYDSLNNMENYKQISEPISHDLNLIQNQTSREKYQSVNQHQQEMTNYGDFDGPYSFTTPMVNYEETVYEPTNCRSPLRVHEYEEKNCQFGLKPQQNTEFINEKNKKSETLLVIIPLLHSILEKVHEIITKIESKTSCKTDIDESISSQELTYVESSNSQNICEKNIYRHTSPDTIHFDSVQDQNFKKVDEAFRENQDNNIQIGLSKNSKMVPNESTVAVQYSPQYSKTDLRKLQEELHKCKPCIPIGISQGDTSPKSKNETYLTQCVLEISNSIQSYKEKIKKIEKDIMGDPHVEKLLSKRFCKCKDILEGKIRDGFQNISLSHMEKK